MGRIIRTQRQQVAVLKAFGYSNRDMAIHYGLFTGVIVLIGALVGVALGAWAADALATVYMEYFRFPEMSFRLQPRVILLGIAVAGGSAMIGTWRAVNRAVSLAPAEAMRPPAPERFHRGWLERSRLGRLLDQSTRIILRNLSRYRIKAALSVVGIALSAALLLVGSYQFNALDQMIDTQYRLVQKSDLVLHFNDATPERAIAELYHHPGVRFAEGFRNVPVRLVNGTRDYRTAIQGMDARPQLRGLINDDGNAIELPPEGLLLTDYLAEHLDVTPGETLTVEIMEGQRRTVRVPLAGVVAEPLGVSAYMERRALNRLMRERPAISGAWLLAEEDQREALYDSLRELPRVAGSGLIGDAETQIRDYIGDTLLITMGILVVLAGSIAFAVVYNNARIAFAERERELATLRVLGFTRGEVAWILMGEIALLTLIAIPVGWILGTALAWLLNEAIAVDLFRLPFIIAPSTYAFAALGVIGASILSLLMISRRLHHLDMVSALKTVE
jgi:putative ABC transport system permease protein